MRPHRALHCTRRREGGQRRGGAAGVRRAVASPAGGARERGDREERYPRVFFSMCVSNRNVDTIAAAPTTSFAQRIFGCRVRPSFPCPDPCSLRNSHMPCTMLERLLSIFLTVSAPTTLSPTLSREALSSTIVCLTSWGTSGLPSMSRPHPTEREVLLVDGRLRLRHQPLQQPGVVHRPLVLENGA